MIQIYNDKLQCKEMYRYIPCFECEIKIIIIIIIIAHEKSVYRAHKKRYEKYIKCT